MTNENEKIYWKGIEELTNDSEFVKYADKEFSEDLPIKDSFGDNTEKESTTRRDFLKMMGFSVAAVSLAACEAPVRKAVSYLNKPEAIEPGVPNYYASTYMEGSEYCAVVVKTREGRPIHVAGNDLCPITKGGTTARVNASVLSLYDNEKAKEPSKGGSKADWASIDKEIIAKLTGIAQNGGQVRIVSQTIMSPSTKRVINDFAAKYPNVQHIVYDAVSAHGILQANKAQFGKANLPSYDFSKAEVIVGIGADFLGTWISPVEYTKQYSQTRKVGKDKNTMSRHYQFESLMTITGASADYRATYQLSEEGLVVAALHDAIASAKGKATVGAGKVETKFVEKCAKDLLKNSESGKASLVVSGSNDVNIQLLINSINDMLGNYGKTISLDMPSFQKQGNDEQMLNFIAEVKSGKVSGIIFYNSNPVYDHPQGKSLGEALAKVSFTVATADRLNETASLCQYNCPDSHYLESWNDAEPKKGFFSLGQPTVGTIFDTRQAQQSLLVWAGSDKVYLEYIREYWKNTLFGLQTAETDFDSFWTRSLHNGVFQPTSGASYQSILMGGTMATIAQPVIAKAEEVKADKKEETPKAETEAKEETPASVGISTDVAAIGEQIKKRYKKAGENELQLAIYEPVLMGWGVQANNPILQDTPDPISKVCWGNYVAVSQKFAQQNNLKTAEGRSDLVTIKVGDQEMTLPVLVQPGQASNTIALALGYGREESKAGKVAAEAGGMNAFVMLGVKDNALEYIQLAGVSVSPANDWTKIAQTQTHQTFMGRQTIVQETILSEYQKNQQAGRYFPSVALGGKKAKPHDLSLWDVGSDGYKKPKEARNEYEKNLWKNRHPDLADKHPYSDHHWGLAIDLNSCTGCSACLVACHLENNVPVVGKTEIARRREMHWIRIDRYYSSTAVTSNAELEKAAEEPEVVFQPMMCQHCNNAPCETVCPVVATTHSSEGLNQMAYNRCIGTKYCANNCPYKVRRFNWFKYFKNDQFDYNMNNDLGRMVLNPDVTVRSRGVIEKCSMCIQRIQAGKLKAKIENRRPVDGEITTACASACPSNAIVFGDLNDMQSGISTLLDHEVEKGRAYNVLEEIATKPNVWYLTKVRNKDKEEKNS